MDALPALMGPLACGLCGAMSRRISSLCRRRRNGRKDSAGQRRSGDRASQCDGQQVTGRALQGVPGRPDRMHSPREIQTGHGQTHQRSGGQFGRDCAHAEHRGTDPSHPRRLDRQGRGHLEDRSGHVGVELFTYRLFPCLPGTGALHLRGAWVAASPTVIRRVIDELGARECVAGYGLSEASPNVAQSCWWEDHEVRASGAMLVEPGVELRIRALDDTRDCGQDEPGSILVRGWNVMQGYLDAPEQTAATTRALARQHRLRPVPQATAASIHSERAHHPRAAGRSGAAQRRPGPSRSASRAWGDTICTASSLNCGLNQRRRAERLSRVVPARAPGAAAVTRRISTYVDCVRRDERRRPFPPAGMPGGC
jgi:hypothetical protein